jgi:hypothetical protein
MSIFFPIPLVEVSQEAFTSDKDITSSKATVQSANYFSLFGFIEISGPINMI